MFPVLLSLIFSSTPAPPVTAAVAMTTALATRRVSTRTRTLTPTISVPAADEVRESEKDVDRLDNVVGGFYHQKTIH